MEDRYDFLLARVGQTLSSHANLPKLLTYIVLFSDENIVTNPEVPPRDVQKIRNIQVSNLRNLYTTFAEVICILGAPMSYFFQVLFLAQYFFGFC